LAELPLLSASPPVQLDQVDAKGDFQLQADGPLVTGSLRAARADLYPFRVQNLRSDIVLTPAAFSFKNLSGQMANGTVHSEGYWAPPGGRLQELDVTSKVAALEIDELAAQFLPATSGRLAGLLSGQARFTAALPDGGNIKDRLESSGEASVQQGTIKDFNLITHLLLRGSGGNISGSRLPPNGPPQSVRSNSMPSSAQHHRTFCTLEEVARPQIFSIAAALRIGRGMEPQISRQCNGDWANALYSRECPVL